MANEQTSFQNKLNALKFSKVVALVIYGFTLVAIVFLSIGFFLLAFGANQDTPFVKFVYTTAYDFMAPFRGIFPTHQIDNNAYFSPSALFAIVMYLFGAFLLNGLVSYLDNRISKNRYEKL